MQRFFFASAALVTGVELASQEDNSESDKKKQSNAKASSTQTTRKVSTKKS